MTTKVKIVSGFTALTILLLAMAFMGYRSLSTSSDNFTDYKRLAQIDTSLSDLKGEMNMMSYYVLNFLTSKDTTNIDLATQSVAEGLRNLDRAISLMGPSDSRTQLENMRDEVLLFPEELKTIRESYIAASEHFVKNLLPLIQASDQRLADLADESERSGNSVLLSQLYTIGYHLGDVRAAVGLYLESMNASFADGMRQNLQSADDKLRVLNYAMALSSYNELIAAWDEILLQFEPLYTYGKTASDAITVLRTHREAVWEAANNANIAAQKVAEARGTAAENSNIAGQRTLLGFSAGGAILALALAMFITLGLLKILNQLSKFSTDIAEGRFNSRIEVREGGEVGAMVAAIRRIPVLLDEIIEETNTIAAKISVGHFRERFEDNRFPGGYTKLTDSINILAQSYTNALDLIPNPIQAGDTECNVTFLNKAAQEVLGGNKVNNHCGDLFNSPVCKKEGCIGASAMRANGIEQGETSVVVGGHTLDIQVMGTPLHDFAGNVRGFMEIITDVTTTKTQQRLMLKTADQATEISNRVAAASEELASQVEQISRGAQMQQERLESTASAMNQMNATVIEVARNASSASEQGEETRRGAQEGAAIVREVVNAINDINNIAATLNDNMSELGRQTESISSVMNVISDIADQTNLLALNAAIEAARAGEAGRGFAVVADEVRKLAEKTMEATHEVGQSINAIQQSSQINISEVAVAVKSVSAATELANQSGNALNSIVDLMSETSAAVTSIATAAEEQSATSEEVTNTVNEVNTLVRETVEGMNQSATAVQDLARTAQELQQIIKTLR